MPGSSNLVQAAALPSQLDMIFRGKVSPQNHGSVQRHSCSPANSRQQFERSSRWLQLGPQQATATKVDWPGAQQTIHVYTTCILPIYHMYFIKKLAATSPIAYQHCICKTNYVCPKWLIKGWIGLATLIGFNPKYTVASHVCLRNHTQWELV